MKKTDVLIIGGSAAGLMAAITVKKRNPEKTVTAVRHVRQTPVPCGIPYIYGILKDVAKNIIPDENFIKMGIDIMPLEVTAIDRSAKTVDFADGSAMGYGKLILATGSKPAVPPISGVDMENVFAIKKDPEHLQKIYTALQTARNVVVIGGGFIGVEMAEQIARMSADDCGDYFCREDGVKTRSISLVEMLPHCLMLACEKEFCIEAEGVLEKMGIDLFTGCQVQAIEGNGRVTGVKLADGRVLPADAVIMGIGVTPNIKLAQLAGLDTDARGGIAVDKFMRTSDPDIYAAGDCAQKFSFINGNPTGIRLASVACSEGMIAASNLYNEPRKTMGALGAFGTTVGDLSIASAGLTTQAAEKENIAVVSGEAMAPNRHPGGLPGCVSDMKAKLLFRKDNGKIVGGHIRGGEAVADMVNIISVAIQSGSTAEELATMQYATHPLLTASPLVYHVMLAAENAAAQIQN